MRNVDRNPVGNPYKDTPKIEKSDLELRYEQAMENKELIASFSTNAMTKLLIQVIEQRRLMLLEQLVQSPLDRFQFIQGEISQLDSILFILNIK